MTDREPDENFLSRWSRRKAQARRGDAPPAPQTPPAHAGPKPDTTAAAPAVARAEEPAEPPPTLDDVATLTPDSDFTRFVAPGVGADVKNAALKKMFAAPNFNVMDGLDVYIDDYTRADPIPPGVLARLAQTSNVETASRATKGPARASSDATGTVVEGASADENADLQLQPHDAAGRAGSEPGAGGDGGSSDGRAG